MRGPLRLLKMQKRNIWMVDNADVLVAIWDGSSGGPKNTVEYTRKVKKPILHIDPKEKTEKWLKP